MQRAVLAAEEAEDAAAPTRALVARLDAARQRFLLAGSPRPLGQRAARSACVGAAQPSRGVGSASPKRCTPWE
jgi:hypothetical protein